MDAHPFIQCKLYDLPSFRHSLKNYKPNFSALHMNMRSMKGKQDPLELFLNSMGFSFDAIIFTETWLTRNDQLPPLSGYKGTGMVREGKRGGGIAIYVKEQHSIIALNELSVMDTNVECMAVNTGNAIVVVVYRPPSGNVNHFLDFFENILAFLGNLYLPFFCYGRCKH